MGTGKTISSGLMALHYIYNKYKWKKEYEEILGHKRLINDKQQVIRGHEVDIDVLVITVNAVIEKYEEDWENVLNFHKNTKIGDFNAFSRVKIINNRAGDSINIDSVIGKKIGLLIVDEAHKFINRKNNDDEEQLKRYESLSKLKAEKIVFLTATPIRYDISDFDEYVNLAHNILDIIDNKELEKRKEELKGCFGSTKDTLICSKLDYKVCATRYFKDTVKKIRNRDFQKIKAKRWVPEIWESPFIPHIIEDVEFYKKFDNIKYEFYSKYNEMYPGCKNGFDHSIFYTIYRMCEVRINNINNRESRDKFLVFINNIIESVKGQDYIENHLKFVNDNYKEDFFGISIKEFDDCKYSKDKVLSYKIVNANTKDANNDKVSAGKFGKIENGPDILIVISQVVEQGLDMPAYSYIINFDIPDSIAALEQRFGRIDRIDDSKYGEIHSIYVTQFRNSAFDNFYYAVMSFRRQLDKKFAIPSKNILINDFTLIFFKNSLLSQIELLEYNKAALIESNKMPSELITDFDSFDYIISLEEELKKYKNDNKYNGKCIETAINNMQKKMEEKKEEIEQLRIAF